jgi:hypothetical protein
MPVILTTPEEVETWMTAARDETLKLQLERFCPTLSGRKRKARPNGRGGFRDEPSRLDREFAGLVLMRQANARNVR